METNEKTPQEKLAEACFPIGPAILLACKRITLGKMNEQLEEKEKFYLLIATALNEKSEKKLLELAKDSRKEVQYALILNPNRTSLVVDKIIERGMPPVVQFLLQNVRLTNSQLQQISKNNHFAIRAMVNSYL